MIAGRGCQGTGCQVRAGRAARLSRRLGFDRNPLRRRWDRVETWIMAGLLTLFLAGVPLTWLGVGRWVQQGGMREQRAQQTWHAVPAVVLHGAPPLSTDMFRIPVATGAKAPAAWTGPGGRRLAGQVPVAFGTRTGARVQVWVDSSGHFTGPPLTPSQLAKRVLGAEVLAALTLAAALLTLAGLARWQLNRRRLAAWEYQWALVGPRWTRPYR
jgi:hypothetical protein